MFNLMPISLLILSIGGIVYIISNHLSDINGDNSENAFKFKDHLTYWVNQLSLGSVKSQSILLTQKLLHRTRLLLLKSDNHLMKIIGKISEHDKLANGNDGVNKSNNDFWNDLYKNKQEKQVVMPPAEPVVKIDLAVKNEAAKKFFDITPPKILENKLIKKTLKIKKSLK